MKFSKSYRLLEFVNRRHGWAARQGFAAGGWLGAMVATRSPVLARSLHREFASDQFDIACRKAVRHARFLSPRLDFFHDPFFDFTTGTDERERRALERILERRRGAMPRTDYLSDLLYIRATAIHQLLDAGRQADVAVQQFYDFADELLTEIEATQPVPAATPAAAPQKPQDFDRARAQRALQDLAELLPLSQWPWYVVSGTLLGLHREGGFLGHDLDMDVAFNGEDVEPDQLLARLSSSQDFSIKRIHDHYDVRKDAAGHRALEKKLALVQLVHRDGTQVDVFLYHLQDGMRWHGSVIHHWQNKPFDLVRRALEGVAVNAPADADLYLTECYGDWRTPRKAFDCNTDTPNLRVANNFMSLALFLKQLAWSAHHAPAQIAGHRATLERSGFLAAANQPARIKRKL